MNDENKTKITETTAGKGRPNIKKLESTLINSIPKRTREYKKI